MTIKEQVNEIIKTYNSVGSHKYLYDYKYLKISNIEKLKKVPWLLQFLEDHKDAPIKKIREK